jgi:hypothetical protein
MKSPSAGVQALEDSNIAVVEGISASSTTKKRKSSEQTLGDTWAAEITALVFAFLCLAAIVIILRTYNGKRIPELPWNISLNAIISALATASKSALLYTVSVSISQSKWVWFKRGKRPLKDLQTFDDASRGPFGSFFLLCGRTVASAASLGAIVTIASLVFDPFIQQVLSYHTEPVMSPSPLAAIKRASNLSQTPEPYFTLSVITGMGSDVESFGAIPSCPTNNCTWPEVKSISWCSKCANSSTRLFHDSLSCDLGSVSDHFLANRMPLNHTCTVPLLKYDQIAISFNLTLAEGDMAPVGEQYRPSDINVTAPHRLLKRIGIPQTLSNPNIVQERTYLNVPNPVFVAAYMEIPLDRLENAIDVTTCVLSPCLRVLSISLNENNVSTKVLSTNYGYTKWFNEEQICWTDDASDTSFTSEWAFCSDYDWGNTFDGIFSFTKWTSWLPYANYWPSWSGLSSDDSVSSSDGDDSVIQKAMYKKGLEDVMASTESSLSKFALDMDPQTVTGFKVLMESRVQVRWQWLFLPFLLASMGAIMLVRVIVITKQQNVQSWRSSVLAFLYHGLDGNIERPENDPTSSMTASAHSMQVQLQISQNGERLGEQ